MKAMIWKELRENLKWAILAMIGLGMAEFYGLFYSSNNEDYQSSGLPLCKATFLMATTFGNALVGLLLGFLQIIPEQRRDQWAALIHRPVSRSVIFRGKVVAGILLYSMATCLPFAMCVWFAATPGHFNAPFFPTMILPGLSDIILGSVYYFAALVVTLQRGSWFGVRTLPLLAAVHASFYPAGAAFFYVVVITGLLMGLLLFVSAWGAILSNGSWSVRPWPTRIALLAVAFFGLCGIGDIVTMLARTGSVVNYFRGTMYEFSREGQPLVISTNPDLTTSVKDLEGRVINDERYQGVNSYDNLLNLARLTTNIGDTHGRDYSFRYGYYRNGYTYVSQIRIYSQFGVPVQWYYLRKQRYFVGISNQNKKPVAIADRTGFKPWGTTPQAFDEDSEFNNSEATSCLLRQGSTLYVFDFVHESEFQILAPGGSRIYGADDISFRTDKPGAYDFRIVMALAHQLEVYDNKGNPVATLPYHQDVEQHGAVDMDIGTPSDHYFIEYNPSYWIDSAKRQQMPSYYEIVDSQGAATQSYVLPALPFERPARTWFEYLSQSIQSPVIWFGTAAYEAVEKANGIEVYDPVGHPAWLGKQIMEYSLVFSLAGIYLARRNRFSWTTSWAWAFFILLFNLGGLIAFRLVADWPVRVKCPSCTRKRPVEETTCPHCHAPWPVHKPDGIEIFEPQSPTLQPVS